MNKSDQVPETVESVNDDLRELSLAFELMHKDVNAGKKIQDGALDATLDAIDKLYNKILSLRNQTNDLQFLKDLNRF